MRGDVVLLWCHSNTHSTIHARMLSVRSAAAATTTITTEVQQEPCSHPISRHVTLCHISLVNIVVVELFIAKVAAVAVQGRDLTLLLLIINKNKCRCRSCPETPSSFDPVPILYPQHGLYADDTLTDGTEEG